MRNLYRKKRGIKTALVAVIFALAGAAAFAQAAEVEKFTAGDFAARRARALEKMEPGVAVVFGAKSGGIHELVQENYFYYFTGVETLDSILVLVKGADGNDAEVLLLPDYDPVYERWDGPRLSAKTDEEENKKLAESLGFDEVASVKALSRRVGRALGAAPNLYAALPYAALDAPLSDLHSWVRDVRDRYPHVAVRNLRPVADELRRVKDAKEISYLQKAIDITGDGIGEALRIIGSGAWEYQLQAALEGSFRHAGAMGNAFPSIVASGPNAVVLHYRNNDRETKKGEMVLMDVGARFSYYCADVSRTVPADGKFTKRQREIYTMVYEAQEAAFKVIKPGATISDVHNAAKTFLKEKGYGKYFLHGTSHYLGLDVHDVGERNAPFAPGAVFTVEPGIYIAEEGIGVRIEDVVVVTEDGYDLMTKHIPREASEVEAWAKRMKKK